VRTTNTSKSILPRAVAAGVLVCVVWLAGCDRFAGTAELAVEVTDALTGEAIEGASVTLDEHSQTTAGAGVYWFREVAAGSHVLDVTSPGYEPHSEMVDVEAGVPQTVYVQLEPGPTGQISGAVRCQCGRGLPGISMYLDGKQVATTDADGSYFFNAPVGQHTVTAGTPNATGAASRSVTVVEGGEQQVDLVIAD
jgi:hypothetical protein